MSRRASFGDVAAVALCFAVALPLAAEPQKRALLIGIDQYAAVTRLKGCVNDVEDMSRLLSGKYGFKSGNITILRNQQATRAGILAALTTLAGSSGKDDIVVVHYSGHGSRVRDVSNDEIDGWDETIVPQDSRQGGIFDITDDELNARLRAIAAKTPNVTFILDSCHSGSATRQGSQTRRAPDDDRIPPAPAQPQPMAAESRTSEIATDDIPYTLIAGCRPTELSNEFDVDGHRRGALTYFLTTELRKPGEGVTYRDLGERLLADVSGTFASQHPQVEGSRQDTLVFGEVEVPGAPYFTVHSTATPVTVDGGAIDGLVAGSRLAVYPAGTKTFPPEAAVAELVLRDVSAFTSTAVSTGSKPVPNLGRAIVTRASPRAFKLRVYLDKPGASAVLTRVKALLDDEAKKAIQTGEPTSLTIVADQRAAHVIVKQMANGVAILHPDLAERSPRVMDATTDDAAQHVISQLRQWSRWFEVAALDNPNAVVPVKFSIRINGKELPQGDATANEGDIAAFNVTNASTKPTYFAVLDLSADGSVSAIYPRHGEEEMLAPGASWEERFAMVTMPRGAVAGEGIFKLIASEAPIPVNRYLQGAVKTVEPVTASAWSTTQRRVRVVRPVRAAGFIIHDPKTTEGTRGVRDGDTIGDCAQGGCYELRSFGTEGMLEAVPGGRGSSVLLGDIGRIWDEAYRLKQETNAAAVEPSLDVDLSAWEPDDAPGSTRSGGSQPPKPGAVADDEWSLKQVNAAGAWQLLRAGGRPDGQEGASVTVAHLDTGYRQHPEVWNADPAKSTVLVAKGYDFLDGDDDPTDELDPSGLLPNPGHGTKSGSAIASPKGAQFSWPNKRHVTGVAPGAHLIPVRVHRSVVHFNSTRLGRAIFEAAGTDRTRVKAPSQVISISMGGLPSLTLWKAVRFANVRGDIVVAAAGNQVGFVVWPARFPETVAVAATNVDCGIWSGSSHGDTVDIAAPGESVWHAEVDSSGENLVAMGSGTTYATANVAGIAALWLDHHRTNPLLRQLQNDGQVTDAFRSMLRASAWVPPATAVPPNVRCLDTSAWNKNETGAGIADAARLLALPLTRPPAVRELGSPTLPLFGSLFPATVSSEEIEERFRRLLRVDATRTIESVRDLEGEIAQSYALNDSVRQAFEAVTKEERPTDAQLDALRKALLAQSVSTRLRGVLS